MRTKLYKVTVNCSMAPLYEDGEYKRWQENYFVTANGESEAVKKAKREATSNYCWDKEDLTRFYIGKAEPVELKGKELIDHEVKVNPKFFSEDTKYVIKDYGNGNYLVRSEMWLQKGDLELVPICKYGGKI